MNHLLDSSVHLPDLPDEILMTIFKKLTPEDVLYSLVGVNKRLDSVACDSFYTNSIDLTAISSTDHIYFVRNTIFDRFRLEILPRIHRHVKWLSVEAACLERIILAREYPQLQGLTLVNLGQMAALQHLRGDSILAQIVKEQITHLDVTMRNDRTTVSTSNATTQVLTILLHSCKRLTSLTIRTFDPYRFPTFSLRSKPTSYFSSTLCHLEIRVSRFEDCLRLLDGHLDRLRTLIVSMSYVYGSITRVNNTELPNLTYFSLTTKCRAGAYKNNIVPLLRRMLNLEQLTLCLTLFQQLLAIDGTCLENDILLHVPRLRTFNFSICSRGHMNIGNGLHHLSSRNIQRTFIDRRICQVSCCVEHYRSGLIQCHVYSLPYTMPELRHITNSFPGGQFHNVRRLTMSDERPFEHEFFDRIAQAFPLLNQLTLNNREAQRHKRQREINDDTAAASIINYRHLTLLILSMNHEDYVEQFLVDTNTRLPCLTDLRITYSQLRLVTDNFTSDALRVNCAQLTHLYMCSNGTIERPTTFSYYFPLLQSIVNY